MSKLAEQRNYLLENGFSEERADRYLNLKEVTNTELNKCIVTLKTLKTILSEYEYKKVESGFNQFYKKIDGAKYDLAYKALDDKIDMYSNYMNEFRRDIRKIFSENIF